MLVEIDIFILFLRVKYIFLFFFMSNDVLCTEERSTFFFPLLIFSDLFSSLCIQFYLSSS